VIVIDSKVVVKLISAEIALTSLINEELIKFLGRKAESILEHVSPPMRPVTNAFAFGKGWIRRAAFCGVLPIPFSTSPPRR
jgi:hypothetical protein